MRTKFFTEEANKLAASRRRNRAPFAECFLRFCDARFDIGGRINGDTSNLRTVYGRIDDNLAIAKSVFFNAKTGHQIGNIHEKPIAGQLYL